MKGLITWLRILLSGKPHFVVGEDPDNPYLLRWYLLPRNHYLNVYLHKFCKDDDDRALHDHPWKSLSLLLWGDYIEQTEDGERLCRPGTILYRKAEVRHRVIVSRTKTKTAWTLFITGRKERIWGFWCPKGFVPWDEFLDVTNKGRVGPGCGD